MYTQQCFQTSKLSMKKSVAAVTVICDEQILNIFLRGESPQNGLELPPMPSQSIATTLSNRVLSKAS